MKPIVLILALLSVGSRSIAQFEDTYQPDSVYRQHNIKSRVLMYDYDIYKTNLINNYDHEGRLHEVIGYDSSGVKVLIRRIWLYDSTGTISRLTEYQHYRIDSTTKKYTLLSRPDTSVWHFAHDSLKRVSTKWLTNTAGKTLETERWSYDGLTITIEYSHANDSVYAITVYKLDKHQALKHASYTSIQNGSASSSGEYAYRNSYDKFGRITNTLVINDNSLGAVESGSVVTSSFTYNYNKSGLLIKAILVEYAHDNAHTTTIVFDYRFW